MWRVIKIFETRNGKVFSLPIRKFSSHSMAEFVAGCLSVQPRYSDVLIGVQKV